MVYVATSWAYREVISSTKLQQMSDNDAALKVLADAAVIATADGGWVDPGALGGGWSNFDAAETTFSKVKYRFKGGRTDITGAVLGGATGTANTILTIPTAGRPRRTVFFATPANAGIADVRVNAAGQVYVSGYYAGGTNGIVSLDVSFIAGP